MEKIIVQGGHALRGSVRVQGAKNAALPILAACVLVNGVCEIQNCPALSDVCAAVRILRRLGCTVERRNDALFVDARTVFRAAIPDELMREMRSSIVFLGAVLSRTGRAVLCAPGGCEIGARPIDLHISSLRAGAAMIVAGLGAQGETVIDQIHHIDRGYEKIEACLQTLGARIERSADSGSKKPEQQFPLRLLPLRYG